MPVPTRPLVARDAVVASAAVACFVALGMLMPDLTPHRLVHEPVGNAELEALNEKVIAGKTLNTLTSDSASLNIVDDYVTTSGEVLERTSDDAEACARRCLANDKCSGFAFGKPEKVGTQSPVCYIIAGPLQLFPNICCTSGIVRRFPH